MSGRRWVVALVTAVVAGAPIAAAPAAKPGPIAIQAKTCGSGYTHAVINRSHKCLRRGQYCSQSADRQYHRYGFHCHKRDARGSYHLT
jgi:hypothetical protein